MGRAGHSWHAYIDATSRHAHAFGSLTDLPDDLQSSIPGIKQYFRHLHVIGNGACGWQALFCAIGETISLQLAMPSIDERALGVTYKVALPSERVHEGGEKLRQALVSKYVGDGEAQKRKCAEYDATWRSAASNATVHINTPLTLSTDLLLSLATSHGWQDIQVLWLALQQRDPTLNLFVVVEEATVTVTRDQSSSPAQSRDSATFTVVETEASQYTSNVVLVSPSGSLENQRADEDNTIVLNLFVHKVLEVTADGTCISTSTPTESAHYWVMTDTSARVRWNHKQACIQF